MISGFAARALIALFAILVAFMLMIASHSAGQVAAKAKTDPERKLWGVAMAMFFAFEVLIILCLGAA